MRRLLVVLGVPIDNLTMDEALARCDEFVAAGRATGRTHQIATVNADFVVNSLHDPELRRILQEADMATADGMPLVWASHLLGGPLPGRVTGADMVPALAARAAERGYSIYFLGAREGVAAMAAEILQQRHPGLKVAGVFSPPPTSVLEMERSVFERVRDARPDILLVAFGNPKQEKWIRMYAPELQIPLCIGVGGALDMIVGVTKRAPAWMQRSGLEWVYRLLQEPRRLLKRYIHDFAYFGYFFVRQWLAMRKGTALNMAPAPGFDSPVAPIAPPAVDLPTTSDPMPIFYVRGRLDAARSPVFLEHARGLLEQESSLIVNLSEAEFLDSTGMGALVAIANQARAAGGTLYLVEVPAVIANLLALVRLDSFFEILPDSAAAERLRNTSDPLDEPQPARPGWILIRAPRMFDGSSAPAFRERCEARMAETQRIVVDLSETTFLASAGMAALIRLDRVSRLHGGELRVAGGSPDVLRTLQLVNLDRVLKLFPTVDAALALYADRSDTVLTGTALPARH